MVFKLKISITNFKTFQNMKILKSKRIAHLLPLVFTSIIAHSASAADGVTNTSVLNEFTNPLGTTITSDGTAGYSGYANVGEGSIGAFTNNGLIIAPNGNGFFNNRPITSWVNNGTVSGTGTDGTGFFQYISTIGALTNTGTISGTGQAFYIYADGNINSFTNSGTGVISGAGATAPTIFLGAQITTFLNEGSINGTSTPAIEIGARGSFGSFTNSGDIRGTTGLSIRGAIDVLINTNNGSIRGFGSNSYIGIQNQSTGRIGGFTNSGSVTAANFGLQNDFGGTITSITNESSGSLTGGGAGIYNLGIIENIINQGVMSSAYGVGISNSGSINVLSNRQPALKYSGPLPLAYNIIVSSPTQYGQLIVTGATGTTTFGISASSLLRAGAYSAVLSGVTPSNLNNIRGTYNGFHWALNNSSGNSWDLMVSNISLTETQASLDLSAQKLKGIYNLQSTAIINGLNYDCRLFDVNSICLSTGGRYSNNHGASGYTTSAFLIGAYRLNKNVHVGAWVDQNLSTNTVTGINLSNSKPLFGVFGAWAENPSGEGYEVKVSAGYGDKDLTVTRDVTATSEAGKGSTKINNQAISTVSSYGFKLNNDVLASPFVGVQYGRVASGGYTEASMADVIAPLTYGRLSQENVSVLTGLKLSGRLDPKTALFGSVGIEQNVNNRSGQYSITGIDGLTVINFNSNIQKTRATVSAGVSYDIDKKQRVSLSGIYREEAFNPMATTNVFATYTVGL
jgi:hypothetical protein